MELKDAISARKVQKADREKLRRDRLNEQFLELGTTIDRDRPKSDKASILSDTIQVLRNLSSEVNRLKAEYATLSEESRELLQEKNELREEKASLRSDIDNLNLQCQQRFSVSYPWAAMHPSIVLTQPYTFSVPLPVLPSSAPVHQPSWQPYSLYENQHPAPVRNPYSTFTSFTNQADSRRTSQPLPHASNVLGSVCSNVQQALVERCEGSNNVGTDLELKIPGSFGHHEASSIERKIRKQKIDEDNGREGSCSTIYSSQCLQDSSSSSINDPPKVDG